jgi:hypothetical protein
MNTITNVGTRGRESIVPGHYSNVEEHECSSEKQSHSLNDPFRDEFVTSSSIIEPNHGAFITPVVRNAPNNSEETRARVDLIYQGQ